MLDLRIIEDLSDVIERRRGNIAGFQNCQPLIACLCFESWRERFLQRLVVLTARVSMVESLVGGDIHAIGSLEEREPKLFRHRTMNRQRPAVFADKGRSEE